MVELERFAHDANTCDLTPSNVRVAYGGLKPKTSRQIARKLSEIGKERFDLGLVLSTESKFGCHLFP